MSYYNEGKRRVSMGTEMPSSNYTHQTSILGVGKIQESHYDVYSKVQNGCRATLSEKVGQLSAKTWVPIAVDNQKTRNYVVVAKKKEVEKLIGKDALKAIQKEAGKREDRCTFIADKIAEKLRSNEVNSNPLFSKD